jgi:SAM-dependent methyltransferase
LEKSVAGFFQKLEVAGDRAADGFFLRFKMCSPKVRVLSVRLIMGILESIHGRFVHTRRVRVLTEHLAKMIPPGSKVLDVGTGDGWLARLLADRCEGVTMHGIDTLVRPDAHIPVIGFDGSNIPHADGSYEVVMMIDVLHHTSDPMVLLAEARRVASRHVLIKDHFCNSNFDRKILRFMDRVSNMKHGVVLTYNYQSAAQWEQHWQAIGSRVDGQICRLGLYPFPANLLFERNMHFIARLALSDERQV